MKSKLIFCSLFALSLLNANASVNHFSPIKIVPKVIYGMDDRMDVYESSDSLMRELSRSTAAQILNNNITLEGDTYTV